VIIGCALALHACAWLAVAVLAASDPSFAVEDDYYQKALDWDKQQEQEGLNADLGWRVEIRTEPRPDGRTDLGVRLTDRQNEPILYARVSAQIFAISRSDRRQQSSFSEIGDGWYTSPFAMNRSGRWEIRMVAKHDEQTFTHDVVKHIVVQLAGPL
jgi:nitrogen fixation protein FixH